MRAIAFILLSTAAGLLHAQDSITLFECHTMAVENAPRLADRELIEQIGELRTEQAKTNWYPTLDFNGKLSYQSDVVTVALTDPSIPVDFPEVPHDQYGLNLDIRQNIYDGGMTKQKKQFEEAKTAADLQQVEVDLYSLKSWVNQYYFSILVLQENRLNLGIHMVNLETRQESMRTAIENGILLEVEMRVIEVEVLKIRQSMLEVESSKQACISALNILCGTDLRVDTQLQLPLQRGLPEEQINRPEYTLFDLKDASLEAGKELTGRKRMPVLYAFGQAGYGKPGYNMMSGEWDSYYMVGAGFKWNIWDWNTTGQEKKVIQNQQMMLKNQRDTFTKEISSRLVQEEAKIEQYRYTMELDEQVLDLQREISKHAATKLSNGTITATDYITELNKESLARNKLATHRIMLAQSITNYLTIQGNL
ncbi:MAG: TolC family protein [Bacteroidetes bacterium]|nr:TolC family protein [Bacteroidota bacterium]